VIEVTPSENLVVFSDRSQHGSYVIRESGERLHVRGRSTEPGDPTGSVLLRERDQIQLGGITLMLEKLTPDMLRDEDIPDEAPGMVSGVGAAPGDVAASASAAPMAASSSQK
jgi:hypothetical protein